MVERWNRTLKERMYRYFTAKNTLKYVNVLQSLVEGYNNQRHTSHGMKPSHVSHKNEKQVWNKLYANRYQVPRKKPKCQEGDKVRLNKKNIALLKSRIYLAGLKKYF